MDNFNRPTRKQIRMPEFDYNSNGAYFLTFCTKDRKPLLSSVSVGTTIGRPPDIILTKYGHITEEAIKNKETHHNWAELRRYDETGLLTEVTYERA